MSKRDKKVTIVVPVYGDWSSLEECIDSLMLYVDSSKHTVILVNDCGPEVENMERNIKAAIEGVSGFKYYRNKKNLGFVGTCNRAVLELDKTKNDIMLLNSDTKVTEGFLEEMQAVLYASEHHGVVSPRSNNATIATIPLRTAHQKGIDQDKSYDIYNKIKNKMPRYYEAPVAHGFCMLIRRDAIDEYGLFDTAFGKGYGEEVDFCMRIRKGGYKCLLSNRAYVFHLEARSFTLESKAKMLEVNNKIIWKRYPEYRQLVRDYMDIALERESKIEETVITKHKVNSLKSFLKRSKTIRKLAGKLRQSAGTSK